MKKLRYLLILLSASLVLSGCKGGKVSEEETLPELTNMTVDGVINEEAYNVIPGRTAGVKAGVLVQYAVGREGVYFGLTVTDTKHQVSAPSGIVASDYVGLAVDALAVPKSDDGVSESTKLFRVDTMGRYTYTTGNEYGAWVDVDSGVYEGVISGEEVPTIAVNIVKDQYYVVEIFFTWEHLGTTEEAAKDANCLMYYIEHRDMGVDIHADANILAPAMYNRLVYLGNRKGSNLPADPPEITIDGVLDETLWDTAFVTNSGNFKERVPDETAGDYRTLAIWGEKGIYLGVEVEDPHIEAPNGTGAAYKNAGMEMRMHVYNKDGLPLNSLKWLFDVWGPQWHETGAGGLASSFAPYAEYKFVISGTIDNNEDTDEGWSFEIYIPFSELGVTNVDSDYIKILHAVGSHEQNNMLPQEYLDLHPDVNWDYPEDYPRISKPV